MNFHSRIVLMLASAMLIAFGSSRCCLAQTKKAMERERKREAAGVIDGAIWSFQLKPATKSRLEPIRGKYRIKDLVIFQPEKPDGEMSKNVGKTTISGQKGVTATFESIAGFTDNKEWKVMKGTAMMKMVQGKPTEIWEGGFTDGDGMKWTMRTTRMQE